ncbi:Circadian input kinase A [Richelia intracellularis]|nr:Circadian input kinase A [Richelia intracellularis]
MGTDRIRQIVLSLRNFSRLDQAEMKAVNIHEGIDSTLLLLQNRCKNQSSNIEIKIIKEYSNLPLVECYAGQLNQVFMNLLRNAVDSLEELMETKKQSLEFIPQMKIMTEEDGEFALIRIAENGMGINAEVQQRLFDPFYTTKEVSKGTYMGLSISYKIIVEKHNGQLQCTSEPGNGAEFMISIPLKQ